MRSLIEKSAVCLISWNSFRIDHLDTKQFLDKDYISFIAERTISADLSVIEAKKLVLNDLELFSL